MPITNPLLNTIRSLAGSLYADLVALRRDLHRHPDLSGQEARTAFRLANTLSSLGLDLHMGLDGRGLWADLVTDPARPTVALRVDTDALPIHELNRVPYRSTVPGVMHACGHDVHAAIGVGVAALLSQMRADLPGNVRIIFQPEEEEITGAVRMLRAGALANPTPQAIFGLHVAPLPVGQIDWTDGLFLAGFEHYLVNITPEKGYYRPPAYLDAVARRCCHAILRLNRWHLPETWPEMQAFWSLMHQGDKGLKKFTVYDASLNDEDPDAWHGQFGLGIKAADAHLRIAALGRVRAALNPVCLGTHTRFSLEPMGAMIDMRNNPHLVRSTLPALEKALGAEHVCHFSAAFPFNCEDFAYYTKRVPGAMYWLGGANPAQGKYALLHTPDFDVDERCIEAGTIAMAALLFSSLTAVAQPSARSV
jgi:amidohydrolase